MTLLYHIKIYTDKKSFPKTDLFSTLERLLPIKFGINEKGVINPAGEIIFKKEVNKNEVGIPKSIPSLKVPLCYNLSGKGKQTQVKVKFADDLNVPTPYRGRILSTKVLGLEPLHSILRNETVLATCNHGPIWTVSDEGEMKHFRSSLPIPQITAQENFSDVFSGERFLEMLPLMHFLRKVFGKITFNSPPLRAAYIFDDPNLHWPNYGYVNYNEIAEHAKRENYHVSFATIPIDAWYTNRVTANIFRKNKRWLSLLIHGNNHAKEELARNYSSVKRKAILQQVIQRIKRIEQRTNLRVCRVMVPPHGACSSQFLAELPKFGFESACISTGSLRYYNRDKSWTKTLGYLPSEVIEGCPVLPRSGMSGNTENTLLLAAYLGRPMILRGHHQDLKHGVEVLDVYAKFINGLGKIKWSNLTGLTRLNYLWRMEGKCCRVKPLSKMINFMIPNDATDIIIEEQNIKDNSIWQAALGDGTIRRMIPDEPLSLMNVKERKITLQCNVDFEAEQSNVRFKPIDFGLAARRILTLARDRLYLT